MVAGAMSVQSSVVVPTDSLDDLSISSSVVDAILNTLSSGDSSEAVDGLTASMSELSNSQLPYLMSEEAVYDKHDEEESSVMSVTSTKASFRGAPKGPQDASSVASSCRGAPSVDQRQPYDGDDRDNEAVLERDGDDLVSIASSKSTARSGASSLRSTDTGKLSLASFKSTNTGMSSLKSTNTDRSSLKSTNTGKSSTKSTGTGKSSTKSTSTGKSSTKSTNTGKFSVKSTDTGKVSLKSTDTGNASFKSVDTDKFSFKSTNTGKTSLEPTTPGEASLKSRNTDKFSIKSTDTVKSSKLSMRSNASSNASHSSSKRLFASLRAKRVKRERLPQRHEDYAKPIAEEKCPIEPFDDELSFKSDENIKPVLSLVDSGSACVTASTRSTRSTNTESSSLMVTVSRIDEETQKLEIEEEKSLIGSFDDGLSFKSDGNIRPDVLPLVDSGSVYVTASTRGSCSTNTESSSRMVTVSRIDEETQKLETLPTCDEQQESPQASRDASASQVSLGANKEKAVKTNKKVVVVVQKETPDTKASYLGGLFTSFLADSDATTKDASGDVHATSNTAAVDTSSVASSTHSSKASHKSSRSVKSQDGAKIKRTPNGVESVASSLHNGNASEKSAPVPRAQDDDTGNTTNAKSSGLTNGGLFASLFGDSALKETEAKDEPEATLVLENEVVESGADGESFSSDAKSVASSTHDSKGPESSTPAIDSTKKTLQDSHSKQTKMSKKSILYRLLSRQKDDDDESTESDWQSSTKSEPESAVRENEVSDGNSIRNVVSMDQSFDSTLERDQVEDEAVRYAVSMDQSIDSTRTHTRYQVEEESVMSETKVHSKQEAINVVGSREEAIEDFNTEKEAVEVVGTKKEFVSSSWSIASSQKGTLASDQSVRNSATSTRSHHEENSKCDQSTSTAYFTRASELVEEDDIAANEESDEAKLLNGKKESFWGLGGLFGYQLPKRNKNESSRTTDDSTRTHTYYQVEEESVMSETKVHSKQEAIEFVGSREEAIEVFSTEKEAVEVVGTKKEGVSPTWSIAISQKGTLPSNQSVRNSAASTRSHHEENSKCDQSTTTAYFTRASELVEEDDIAANEESDEAKLLNGKKESFWGLGGLLGYQLPKRNKNESSCTTEDKEEQSAASEKAVPDNLVHPPQTQKTKQKAEEERDESKEVPTEQAKFGDEAASSYGNENIPDKNYFTEKHAKTVIRRLIGKALSKKKGSKTSPTSESPREVEENGATEEMVEPAIKAPEVKCSEKVACEEVTPVQVKNDSKEPQETCTSGNKNALNADGTFTTESQPANGWLDLGMMQLFVTSLSKKGETEVDETAEKNDSSTPKVGQGERSIIHPLHNPEPFMNPKVHKSEPQSKGSGMSVPHVSDDIIAKALAWYWTEKDKTVEAENKDTGTSQVDVTPTPQVGVTPASLTKETFKPRTRRKSGTMERFSRVLRSQRVESTQTYESELLNNLSMDNSAIFSQETGQKSDITEKVANTTTRRSRRLLSRRGIEESESWQDVSLNAIPACETKRRKAREEAANAESIRMMRKIAQAEAARIASRIAERRVRFELDNLALKQPERDPKEPSVRGEEPPRVGAENLGPVQITFDYPVDSLLKEYREQEEPPLEKKLRNKKSKSNGGAKSPLASKAIKKPEEWEQKKRKSPKKKKKDMATASLLIPTESGPVLLERPKKRRWGILPRKKRSPRAVESVPSPVAKDKKRLKVNSNDHTGKRGRWKRRKENQKERPRSRSLERTESLTNTRAVPPAKTPETQDSSKKQVTFKAPSIEKKSKRKSSKKKEKQVPVIAADEVSAFSVDTPNSTQRLQYRLENDSESATKYNIFTWPPTFVTKSWPAKKQETIPAQVKPSPKPEKRRRAVMDMCCNWMCETLVDDLLFQFIDDDDNDSFATRDTRTCITRATHDETTVQTYRTRGSNDGDSYASGAASRASDHHDANAAGRSYDKARKLSSSSRLL